MASFMKDFEHLEIQLEDIKSATNNFDESKVIGTGGFGKVYAGELSLTKGRGIVALKRLDRKHGQGDPQFWKEIMMLSRYTHENLISLLGFCNKEGEMILVYEHASRGSLDRYLKHATLTWTERIKICLDAAKGLSFLHDPNESHQRVLHCDVKSANILLDDNLNAKVSDFGLSKMGSAEKQFSVMITDAVGTHGYCDPVYMETYQLTKESDVYSFGVVLFEVMCGQQCVEYSNGRVKCFVPFWKKNYEENKLDEIIFKDLKQQMNQSALETFASIAYQCLKRLREERPSMSLIVEKLKDAFEVQERHDIISKLQLPNEYEEIALSATSPLMYTSIDELKWLFYKGVRVNKDKTLLSINEKGEHIEKIYIDACLDKSKHIWMYPFGNFVNSRFPGGQCYEYGRDGFKAHVRAEYLTPHISYTVNLAFRYKREYEVNSYNHLRYKIDGEDETKVFIIYPSIHVREDGWFIVPLYHFTSQHKTADLHFEFECCEKELLVAGIEFQPFEEKVQLQVFQEYQHIVEVASQSLFYTSLDELKQILSKGVHLNGYKMWFSLNEKGEHCHMISMKHCLIPSENSTPRYESNSCSRFPAGLYQTDNKGFKTHLKSQLLSPSITYVVNLVCCGASGEQVYVDLKYRLRGETTSTVYLANRIKYDNMYHMAELYQFTSDGGIVDLEIDFDDHGTNLRVEGILFQPLEKVEDQLLEDDKVEDIETISDSDIYWEQKIPNDYEEILKLSRDSFEWKTKKELYSILCKGFLLDNGQKWFSVDKNGKKCQMLSARAAASVIDKNNSNWESSNESRFGEVLVITRSNKFIIQGSIEPQEVSPETAYAAYLVFKLPQDQSAFEAPIEVNDENAGFFSTRRYKWFIYLVSPPHTPIIGQNCDVKTYNPLNRYKGNAIWHQRSDGWMEVQVWNFHSSETKGWLNFLIGNTKPISMHLKLQHPGERNLKGLMVQGIEIRPI
ncbi:protein kinase-like domain, Phloem protein 2-like protein [Artemisia annua]|uniref:Protein kinase-like domain, Phloem protein 2-like protein n=1 Tax=Artemisia annua TaxID=35608 RepID=A0A2U1PYI5_ARTAN|nr:protein kinase-like domain, Phloem protein 2-like protein [Artemisia annua]